MAEREGDDATDRRLMSLGRGVQADFDETLAELADVPRRLPPRPDRGLAFGEAAQRVMHQHRRVFAALAESERRDREAEAGAAKIVRGLSR